MWTVNLEPFAGFIRRDFLIGFIPAWNPYIWVFSRGRISQIAEFLRRTVYGSGSQNCSSTLFAPKNNTSMLVSFRQFTEPATYFNRIFYSETRGNGLVFVTINEEFYNSYKMCSRIVWRRFARVCQLKRTKPKTVMSNRYSISEFPFFCLLLRLINFQLTLRFSSGGEA
jgi:hypothetical protein